MNIRRWIRADRAAGALTLLLIVALTIVSATGWHGWLQVPLFAIAILAGAYAIAKGSETRIINAQRSHGDRYIQGVTDTVDRLAQALPSQQTPPQRSTLRRIV